MYRVFVDILGPTNREIADLTESFFREKVNEYLKFPNATVRIRFVTDEFWYVNGVEIDSTKQWSFSAWLCVATGSVTDMDVAEFIVNCKNGFPNAVSGFFTDLTLAKRNSVAVVNQAGELF